MAVLAGLLAAPDDDLRTYLDRTIFADAAPVVVEPDPADVEGYATFLDRYVAGLDIERVAAADARPRGADESGRGGRATLPRCTSVGASLYALPDGSPASIWGSSRRRRARRRRGSRAGPWSAAG